MVLTAESTTTKKRNRKLANKSKVTNLKDIATIKPCQVQTPSKETPVRNCWPTLYPVPILPTFKTPQDTMYRFLQDEVVTDQIKKFIHIAICLNTSQRDVHKMSEKITFDLKQSSYREFVFIMGAQNTNKQLAITQEGERFGTHLDFQVSVLGFEKISKGYGTRTPRHKVNEMKSAHLIVSSKDSFSNVINGIFNLLLAKSIPSSLDIMGVDGSKLAIHKHPLTPKFRSIISNAIECWNISDPSQVKPNYYRIPLSPLPNSQQIQRLDYGILDDKMNKFPTTVITGFSGSGKTTYLNWLAHQLQNEWFVVSFNLAFHLTHFFPNQIPSTIGEMLKHIIFIRVNDEKKSIEITELITETENSTRFLVDGIDEIPPGMEEAACHILEMLKDFALRMKHRMYFAMEDASLANSFLRPCEILKIPQLTPKQAGSITQSCIKDYTDRRMDGALDNSLAESALGCVLIAKFLFDSQSYDFPPKLTRLDKICKNFDKMFLFQTIKFLDSKTTSENHLAKGHNISDNLLDLMKESFEWAHIPLALQQVCPSQTFECIHALVKYKSEHITQDDLVDFGLVCYDGTRTNLKFSYPFFFEYIISLLLCKAAKRMENTLNKYYLDDVAALFVSFVYDPIKTGRYLMTDDLETQNCTSLVLLRYQILNELLKGRTLNPDFIQAVTKVTKESQNKLLCKRLDTFPHLRELISKTAPLAKRNCV